MNRPGHSSHGAQVPVTETHSNKVKLQVEFTRRPLGYVTGVREARPETGS